MRPAVLLAAAAAVVAGAGVEVAGNGHGACSPDLVLQRLGEGRYASATTGETTTCRELSNGACPFAVPFPDFPCLVTCVASEAECAEENSHAQVANPFVEPEVCTACPITACAACNYKSAERTSCRMCFPGFIGVGKDGDWAECVLWDQKIVIGVFEAMAFLGVVLVVIIFVGTVLGTVRTVWRVLCSRRVDAAILQPLVETWDKLEHNKAAIHQGLMHSIRSSIKMSALLKAMQRQDSRGIPRPKGWRQWLFTAREILSDKMEDLGLGLQLFFRTQIFLISVAFVVFVAATLSTDPGLFNGLSAFQTCPSHVEEFTAIGAKEAQRYRAHASKMMWASLWVWAVVVAMSFVFHWGQMNFQEAYDRATRSSEDYTILLEGLPRNVTSEKQLKEFLEEEFHVDLYGVSICYDIQALPEPTRVQEMVEHLVEYDDIVNGWVEDELSSSRTKLEALMQQDAEELKEWLAEGKLQGSGRAYVVFENQRAMAQVLGERRGIAEKRFPGQEVSSKEGSGAIWANHSTLRAAAEEDFRIKTVRILKDDGEPAGLRYYEFLDPPEKQMRNIYVYIPMRMLLYIGIYAAVAQIFYSTMIKPWQDNFIEGAEGSSSVKLAGKIVLLFNFGIQTMVMMDVERAGFVRTSEVDQITFVWNTALLLVTNAYVFMQECFREGIRWNLLPPDPVKDPEAWWAFYRTSFMSSRVEKEVGDNLVSVMTDQIMMLYVLGEVANVLLPVICYYAAIRLVYVYNVGGSENSVLQRFLRQFLIRSKHDTAITVREAERAQILVPLLLWMEYTYIVIFPAMAFITFYLLTDQNSTVCGWLLGFSVLFFIWQRYFMLWAYGKSTYDSQDSYQAFIKVWGVVLSMLPPASIWWAWRLGQILEYPFVVLTMLLVYFLALLIYLFGLTLVSWYVGEREDGVDDLEDGQDLGYRSVMEEHLFSWWNMNPVYVLKNRHCPFLPGHEVQPDREKYWPEKHRLQGYFELGKEFRHVRNPHAGLRSGGKRVLSLRASISQLFSSVSASATSESLGPTLRMAAVPEQEVEREQEEAPLPGLAEAATPSYATLSFTGAQNEVEEVLEGALRGVVRGPAAGAAAAACLQSDPEPEAPSCDARAWEPDNSGLPMAEEGFQNGLEELHVSEPGPDLAAFPPGSAVPAFSFRAPDGEAAYAELAEEGAATTGEHFVAGLPPADNGEVLVEEPGSERSDRTELVQEPQVSHKLIVRMVGGQEQYETPTADPASPVRGRFPLDGDDRNSDANSVSPSSAVSREEMMGSRRRIVQLRREAQLRAERLDRAARRAQASASTSPKRTSGSIAMGGLSPRGSVTVEPALSSVTLDGAGSADNLSASTSSVSLPRATPTWYPMEPIAVQPAPRFNIPGVVAGTTVVGPAVAPAPQPHMRSLTPPWGLAPPLYGGPSQPPYLPGGFPAAAHQLGSPTHAPLPPVGPPQYLPGYAPSAQHLGSPVHMQAFAQQPGLPTSPQHLGGTRPIHPGHYPGYGMQPGGRMY